MNTPSGKGEAVENRTAQYYRKGRRGGSSVVAFKAGELGVVMTSSRCSEVGATGVPEWKHRRAGSTGSVSVGCRLPTLTTCGCSSLTKRELCGDARTKDGMVMSCRDVCWFAAGLLLAEVGSRLGKPAPRRQNGLGIALSRPQRRKASCPCGAWTC